MTGSVEGDKSVLLMLKVHIHLPTILTGSGTRVGGRQTSRCPGDERDGTAVSHAFDLPVPGENLTGSQGTS